MCRRGETTPYYNPQYSLGGWRYLPSFINHKTLRCKGNRTKIMNTLAIVSGNFSSGEKAQGNYTGYTALGKKVFIFKRQMESLGWSSNEDIQYPFYAVAEEKTIGKLDANRNPMLDEAGNPVTTQRLQATSVFTTKDAIINACVEEYTLGAEIKEQVAKVGKSKGLSDAVVNSLQAAF